MKLDNSNSRRSTFLFGVRVFDAVMGFVALYFVSHHFGPSSLGVIAYLLSLLMILSFTGDLGFNIAHIKRISEGQELSKCIATFAVIKIFLTILFTLLCFALLYISDNFLDQSIVNEDQKNIFYILILYFVFNSLSRIPLSTFRARKESAKQGFSRFIYHFFRSTIAILVAVKSLELTYLAGSYAIAALLMLIYSCYLFRDYPIGHFDKKQFQSYLKFALPVMFITFLGIISTSIDKIMVELFWESEQVGYYFGAQRIAQLLLIFSAPIMNVLIPTMSELNSKSDLLKMTKIVHRSEKYIALITFPLVAILAVYSVNVVVLILGDDFLASASILSLLCLAMLGVSLNRPYFSVIIGIDRPGLIAKVTLYSYLINILLNILLIPSKIGDYQLFGLGAMGAAFATMFSTFIFGSFMVRYYAFKYGKVGFNKSLPSLIISTAIMGLILYLIGLNANLDIWYLLIISVILGLISYVLILYSIGGISSKEVSKISESLNPYKMWTYASNELRGSFKK